VLVEDLTVFNPTRHTATFNTQSTKSVYKNAVLYNEPVLDQHAGSNHQNLFDNLTVHISPTFEKGRWRYPLFDGSGAGYWQPGHGAFNTTYNLKVVVDGGPQADESVLLEALAEGPDARIIGIYGNRAFSLDYRPAPVIRALNSTLDKPSLYDWQLGNRMRAETGE
jgi:hypothetical protein